VRKQSISNLTQWQDKTVLVRVDFNVPLDAVTGVITDDTRIKEVLPTLDYLVARGAKVVVLSHLGRPKGVTPALSLQPVADRLQQLMVDCPVRFLPNSITEVGVAKDTQALIDQAPPASVVVLQNVRFTPAEEANDPAFAQQLAQLGSIYVNDAFGTAHRAHASTEGVARLMPVKVAGLLMEREINALSGVLQHPERPFVAVIGGSKISTKITVLQQLLNKVDVLVIGGGMMFTFLAAQGLSVGTSLVEPDFIDTAKALLQQAKTDGKTLLLTQDVVIADRFAPEATHQVVATSAIPDGWMGLDIGPKSIADVEATLKQAKTVLWNGPMGVFEFEAFATGTKQVATLLAQQTQAKACTSILGGGDTVAAIEAFGIDPHQYTHVSTGGGASLEFLEGKTLPGIAVLDDVVPAEALSV
jgi:phosphoglycerate kinase